MSLNKEPINSGITLTLNDASLSMNGFGKWVNILSRTAITFTLIFGIITAFTSMMNISLNNLFIVAVTVPLSFVFTYFFYCFKKRFLFLIIGAALIGGFSCFFIKQLPLAFSVIYITCKRTIFNSMRWTVAESSLSLNDENILLVTVCICIIGAFLCLLLSFFISAYTNAYIVGILTVPWFVFGMIFGCVPSLISSVLTVCSLFAVVTLHISNKRKNIAVLRLNERKTVNREYAYSYRNRQFGISALTCFLSVALCFTVSFGFFSDYTFSKEQESRRENLIESIVNTYDLITGEDHDASMKDGKLYKYADRKVKNRHYLTLTSKNINQNIYLKGFTGSIYTGFSWTDFDDTAYSSIDEIKGYLKNKKMSLATLSGDLLEKDKYEKNLKSATFTLSNFRRDKDYLYIQNGTVSDGNMISINDIESENSGLSEYSYKAYYDTSSLAAIPYTSMYTDEEFKQEWISYCRFVLSNYTLLPEGIDDVARLSKEFTADNIYELVDVVRRFLAENTEYSDSVNKLPDDKDFVSYFIYEKGKGYSPHYATACAVILRSLGVPTRYCEGFFVPAEQINGAKESNGKKEIEITDKNSHAWIEIFDTNYGWLPIEVTPGYYETSYAKTIEKQRSEVSKSTERKKPKNNNASDLNQKPENNYNNSVEGKPIEQEKSTVSLTAVYITGGVISAVLIILVLFLLIRRNLAVNKRSKVFNSANYKKQVILAFSLIIDMLKFLKILVEKEFEFERFKALLKENYSSGEFSVDDAVKIYEKAMFSKIPILSEDADKVLDFLDDFGYGIYSEQTFKNKLLFKFIYNLI